MRNFLGKQNVSTLRMQTRGGSLGVWGKGHMKVTFCFGAEQRLDRRRGVATQILTSKKERKHTQKRAQKTSQPTSAPRKGSHIHHTVNSIRTFNQHQKTRGESLLISPILFVTFGSQKMLKKTPLAGREKCAVRRSRKREPKKKEKTEIVPNTLLSKVAVQKPRYVKTTRET